MRAADGIPSCRGERKDYARRVGKSSGKGVLHFSVLIAPVAYTLLP